MAQDKETRESEERNRGARQQQGTTQQGATRQAGQGTAGATEREAGTRVERGRDVPVQREGRMGTPARQEPGLSSLAAVSPFETMRRLTEDMNRLVQGLGFGQLGLTPFSGIGRDLWAGMPAIERSLWAPQIESFKRGDKLVVRADLPGLTREDVDVEITDDNVLTIAGERREQAEDRDEEGFYRSERSYGRFFRSIPLPEGIDAEQCEATFKDGVLEVTLPAPRQERRGRRVEVRS